MEILVLFAVLLDTLYLVLERFKWFGKDFDNIEGKTQDQLYTVVATISPSEKSKIILSGLLLIANNILAWIAFILIYVNQIGILWLLYLAVLVYAIEYIKTGLGLTIFKHKPLKINKSNLYYVYKIYPTIYLWYIWLILQLPTN